MSDYKIVYIDDDNNQRVILASTYAMLKALYPSNGRVMYIGEADGTEFALDWDGLRLLNYVYRDALSRSPFQVNWKDPAQMATMLHRIEREVPGTGGDYTVFLEYGQRSDFNADGTAWLTPDDPPYVIVSVKAYTGDRDGPGSRALSNRIYRDDGTYVEEAVTPTRTYARAVQIEKGRIRRQAHWDNLIVDFRAPLEAAAAAAAAASGAEPSPTAAADVISYLDPGISRFVDSAESDGLVTLMSGHPVLINFVPHIQAALSPWDDTP